MQLTLNSRQLPRGWEIKYLDELCENLDSKRVPITKSSRKSGNIPYYGASGIVDYVADYIFDEDLLLVSEDGANLLARTYPIAFSITGKAWVNNHAHILRFKEKITQNFIEYYLNSISLEPYVTGMAQPKLNQKSLNSIAIPYPPLSEQKRIVAILDEAFEGIDRAIANTEKNLANSRELFESYLNAIFTQKGDDWVEKKLHSVVEPSCSLSYGIVQPGNDYENGLPVVRPTDLTTKTINLSSLKRIDPLLADSYKRTKLSGGELLVCVRGNTGIVGIAADELKGANVTRGIVPIRFEQSIVIQAFGYYMLISKIIQDQIKEKTYGTALMQINIRDLKNIVLSFPEPDAQQILVEKLDRVEKETQSLEAIYRQKLAALNELKQSILQKAFTGELTADTPKTVKEEIAA